MSAQATIELVVVISDEQVKRDRTAQVLIDMDRRGEIELLNLAALAKSEQGQVYIREALDVTQAGAALVGAAAGGAVGLLSGFLSGIIAALAGAVIGFVVGSAGDAGVSAEHLLELAEGLPAGTTAILVLVESEFVQMVVSQVRDQASHILRFALAAQALEAGGQAG
jgi:uncharacterized membrane protein